MDVSKPRGDSGGRTLKVNLTSEMEA
jgi:hypothetical protein